MAEAAASNFLVGDSIWVTPDRAWRAAALDSVGARADGRGRVASAIDSGADIVGGRPAQGRSPPA